MLTRSVWLFNFGDAWYKYNLLLVKSFRKIWLSFMNCPLNGKVNDFSSQLQRWMTFDCKSMPLESLCMSMLATISFFLFSFFPLEIRIMVHWNWTLRHSIGQKFSDIEATETKSMRISASLWKHDAWNYSATFLVRPLQLWIYPSLGRRAIWNS